MTCWTLLFALALGMPLGAFLLLAAIGLWNNHAVRRGLPPPVPQPRFWRAMGVMFVAIVVRFFTLVAITGVWTHFQPDAIWTDTSDLLVGVSASLAALLAMMFTLTRVLPTGFKQAAGIALIFAMLVAVFGGIVYVATHMQRVGPG